MLYRKIGLSPEMNQAIDELQAAQLKVWEEMVNDPCIRTEDKERLKRNIAEHKCWEQHGQPRQQA